MTPYLTISGKSNLIHYLITAFSILATIIIAGCPGEQMNEKPEPILRDAYSLYILEPGPFEALEPEFQTPREFLILKTGGVEISCGIFQGAGFEIQGERLALSIFANESIVNDAWLPGVSRYVLDGSEISMGGREYYCATLLVRRDAEQTALLDNITRAVHAREMGLFPVDEDRIVRLYYTAKESDIYIFTLSGTPEDIAFRERDIRRLLASVRLSATEAMQETGTAGF